jgi:hypothetical protein
MGKGYQARNYEEQYGIESEKQKARSASLLAFDDRDFSIFY